MKETKREETEKYKESQESSILKVKGKERKEGTPELVYSRQVSLQ